jgi:hypothetical protein
MESGAASAFKTERLYAPIILVDREVTALR